MCVYIYVYVVCIIEISIALTIMSSKIISISIMQPSVKGSPAREPGRWQPSRGN